MRSLRYLVRHEYKNTKRGGGNGYPPVGIFTKPRAERRAVARLVRRQTRGRPEHGQTISDTVRIIQAGYIRKGVVWA